MSVIFNDDKSDDWTAQDEAELTSHLADRIVTWVCLTGLAGLVLAILTGVIK